MESKDAIEKLAEYRESSKMRVDVDDEIQEPNPTVESIRQLAIKIVWFNAFF